MQVREDEIKKVKSKMEALEKEIDIAKNQGDSDLCKILIQQLTQLTEKENILLRKLQRLGFLNFRSYFLTFKPLKIYYK